MREVREKLMEELRELERELRVELPKEIKTALAMGDLRENAEYHAALERQGLVRARMAQLRQRLTDLGTMSTGQIPTDRAGLGSTLKLLDLDSKEEVTYELVLPELADLSHGLISVASPVGRGLLDRREGDDVTIQIPSGTRRFEVLSVRTVHDKTRGGAGDENPAS
jgi:transcription elongation factor GreA